MTKHYTSYVDAKASHHLVWALRITADSYTQGIVQDRLCTHPMNVLKACVLSESRNNSNAAIARLPYEVLALIEDYLTGEAKIAAALAIKDYTWSKQRREGHQSRTSDNEESAEIAETGEAGVSTSDEDDGADCDADISESETHRDKMDERALFFQCAAQKMRWLEQRLYLGQSPLSENCAHLRNKFGLNLVVMNSRAFFKRRGKIMHVYLCLPWATVELLEDLGRKSDEISRTLSNIPQESRVMVKRMENPNPRLHSSLWSSRYEQTICEIDAEYLQLTEAKIRKINRAVQELKLDVVSLGLPLMDIAQDEGFASRPAGFSTRVYRLSSNFNVINEAEAPRNWVPSFSTDEYSSPWLIDRRFKPWPTTKDSETGDILYIPKLLSLLEQDVNSPERD